MKFGIALSNRPWARAIDVITKAEKLDYDSLLISDHYMLPGNNETLETWIYLSYIAAKVSSIRLGTCVTPIPFRPPSLLAKAISTLDFVSNGRVIVGVGLGWYPDEFEAYSTWDPLLVRFEKTKEALELMVKLWTEDEVNFEGKYYRVNGAVLQPKPVQKPHPPLWFGGKGKKMLKLTAEMGDGWIIWGPRWAPIYTTAEEYKGFVETIKKHRESLGKNDKFTFALAISPQENFKEFTKEIEDYKKAGMDYLVISVSKADDSLNLIERFKNEIVQSFR